MCDSQRKTQQNFLPHAANLKVHCTVRTFGSADVMFLAVQTKLRNLESLPHTLVVRMNDRIYFRFDSLVGDSLKTRPTRWPCKGSTKWREMDSEGTFEVDVR